jgi:hypothetical protein
VGLTSNELIKNIFESQIKKTKTTKIRHSQTQTNQKNATNVKNSDVMKYVRNSLNNPTSANICQY